MKNIIIEKLEKVEKVEKQISSLQKAHSRRQKTSGKLASSTSKFMKIT